MKWFISGIVLCMLGATIIIACIFAVELGFSQSDHNWGQSSCGAQLSIGLNTNILKPGSPMTFYVRIKNSSANTIKINPKLLEDHFILTDSIGRTYRVTPMFIIDDSMPFNPTVNAREVREWPLRVRFGVYNAPGDAVFSQIEPGNYVLEPITRDIITADGKACTLTSNSLDVKVVKK
jgi:hypothetical protein